MLSGGPSYKIYIRMREMDNDCLRSAMNSKKTTDETGRVSMKEGQML